MGALDASIGFSAVPQGSDVYSKAVEAAARVSGGVSRVQVEAITAAVINSLYQSTAS